MGSGATIHDTIKAFKYDGVCTEDLWPYITEKVTEEPSQAAYEETKGTVAQNQRLIQDIETFKTCLDKNKPFVFAFYIYNRGFDEAGRSGVLPVPTREERYKKPDGCHAVMAVDYSNEWNAFLILNSYGPEWGEYGYFYMPYEFIITDPDFCFNFWTVTFNFDHNSPAADHNKPPLGT